MATIVCDSKFFTDIKAIFLDKDGTLADVNQYLSSLGHHQAQLLDHRLPGTYGLALKTLGISAEGQLNPGGLMAVGSRQETILALGIALKDWCRECSREQAMDLAAATLAAADERCRPKAPHTPLLPGALDFLQRLRRGGLAIGMVSADGQRHLEEFVAHYGLGPYFDHLQGVSLIHPSKVAPSFLKATCHAMDVAPQEGLVIGDAASDLQVASQTAGFIGFLGGWQPHLQPETIAAQAHLNGLSVQAAFATAFGQIQVPPEKA